jgi:type II secretory pathway component PulC
MIATSLFESFLDFKLLKRVLIGFSVLILLFIPIDFLYFRFSHQTSRESVVQNQPALGPSTFEHQDAYESSIQSSAVFGLATPEGSLTVLKSSMAELTKDYRLKGVMIVGEPEAIMEDARTQKSIFVKEGDLLGDLKVKEIKEGAVILTYYGEEKELRIQ